MLRRCLTGSLTVATQLHATSLTAASSLWPPSSTPGHTPHRHHINQPSTSGDNNGNNKKKKKKKIGFV